MKKNILFFIAIWFCNIAIAQNFTSDITSTIGSNAGGQLNLTNSIKIGKNVKTWTLFNMTGPYGNGLNFWAYAADGTNLGTKMTLSDDGSLNVNTGSIFSRNGSVYASLNSNEGPFLSLINPGKTANGTANDWRIYNMTGSYGNSLQFWNYGNGGFYGSRFTILDNGNVGIGTTTPTSLLGLVKNNTTNENDIIASFLRGGGPTGGSSIVRFGYHNTGDLEINSGYTAAGYRFGSYCDYNIVNNQLGGDHGGINLVTNNSVKVAVRPSGNVGIGTSTPSNSQGWNKVLDVAGSSHAKILATSDNATFRTGLYAHSSWYGGGGFVGTESNHNLFLIAGYEPKMTVLTNGNVGIGTTTPDAKLAVKGQIHAQEVKVDLLGAMVPDYVFAKEYKLKSLAEVEAYVKTNSHLPEVPSAKQIEKNGLQLGEMNMVLLKKIEELTLHAIEQQKQIEFLKTENNTYKTLAERLTAIEKELTKETK